MMRTVWKMVMTTIVWTSILLAFTSCGASSKDIELSEDSIRTDVQQYIETFVDSSAEIVSFSQTQYRVDEATIEAQCSVSFTDNTSEKSGVIVLTYKLYDNDWALENYQASLLDTSQDTLDSEYFPQEDALLKPSSDEQQSDRSEVDSEQITEPKGSPYCDLISTAIIESEAPSNMYPEGRAPFDCRGMVCDLNNDGIDELVMVYDVGQDDMALLYVYTLDDTGIAIPLIEKHELFSYAGGRKEFAVGNVVVEDEEFFAVFASDTEGYTYDESWTLFQMDKGRFIPVRNGSQSVSYEDVGQTIELASNYSLNGIAESKEDYMQWKDTIAWGYPIFSNTDTIQDSGLAKDLYRLLAECSSEQ